MIAILDYDAGNIKSVEKAFGILGEETILTRDFSVIEKADRLVLPGVGSFADAMEHLKKYELDKAIKDYVQSGKPFIGICLGLQLLFESSEESPGVEGLHLLDGVVKRIPDRPGIKVPHIGWNSLDFPNKGKLFEGIDEGSFVYFVHSYYLDAKDKDIVTATTDYSAKIEASVESGNVFACQFHPEKSAEVGMQILRNFTQV